ncbi:MAG: TM1802 family CRISPR-associated protein [Caldisphaera sp.]
MLRELAAFGREYKKISSLDGNKDGSNSSIIVIYIDLSRNCKVDFKYSSEEECKNLIGYDIYGPRISSGTLEYPVGEFASIDKNGKVAVLRNRIINWFKKQNEYKDYYNILNKNLERINRELIETKSKLDKDKSNANKRKIIVTVKVSGKFPKEILKPAAPKGKNFIKGYCFICGEEKNNILFNYKDISKIFGFYTLDKAGFASNFDVNAMSANLPICNDCLEDIKSGVIFWNRHFVDLQNKYRMWILPSLIGYNKENLGDNYNEFKRTFRKFVNYLERNDSSNDIQKYLIDERSPDIIFNDKSYIIFRKNHNQWVLEHEYEDINVGGIKKIIEKNEELSRNYMMKNYSFLKRNGLIKYLCGYFIPEDEIFKNFSYYKDEIYSKSIRFTFNSIVNYGQLPKEDYEDFVNLSNFVFDRIIRSGISEKSKKESKIVKILSSLYAFSLKSLYIKSLLSINVEKLEENEKAGAKGKIMNLITDNLNEEEQAFVYIGMLVGGLSKLQNEIGISSNILEKLLYLPDKQHIIRIFNDVNDKIRQYQNYKNDHEYSDFFNKFDILNSQIANLAEKLAHSLLSDDLAKFFFNVGVGFSNLYFYSGKNENQKEVS